MTKIAVSKLNILAIINYRKLQKIQKHFTDQTPNIQNGW